MQFEKLPIQNYIPGSYERGILTKLEWELFTTESQLHNLNNINPNLFKFTLLPKKHREILSKPLRKKITNLKERILLMREVA